MPPKKKVIARPAGTPTAIAQRKDGVWSDDYYVIANRLAANGFPDTKIADAIGVHWRTFQKWLATKPSLVTAIHKGRTKYDEIAKTETPTFMDYVFHRLSPENQDAYENIIALQRHPNVIQKVRAILANKSKRCRQELFLYALVSNNWNTTQALHTLGMNKATLDDWVENDPHFAHVFDELHWHKKNFFEHALMDLVEAREKSVVIFANKTYNRDRGYGEQQEIKVTHTQNTVNVVDLPLELREAILAAHRAKKAEQNAIEGQVEEDDEE